MVSFFFGYHPSVNVACCGQETLLSLVQKTYNLIATGLPMVQSGLTVESVDKDIVCEVMYISGSYDEIKRYFYSCLCGDSPLFNSLYISQMAVFQSDRKSTRLNSSHVRISYAVFCLKKK